MDNVAHSLCCRIRIHQHVHLRRESQSHAPSHVLMRSYPIDKSLLVDKAKEERHVRIKYFTKFIIYFYTAMI